MNKEMVDQQPQLAKSHNFTAAFEQMCFAAIASTVSPEDVLRQLVLQCFVVLPEDQFSQAHQIAEAISVLFGLEISSYQIQTALDQLETQKVLQRPLNTNYVLDIAAKRQLEERLNSARELEERVRDEWLAELTAQFPSLPTEPMWNALRRYLAKSFRRHGIQAAALLDPSIEAPNNHSVSLSTLLDEALQEVFSEDKEHTIPAHKAISHFFAAIGESPDRATYIAQLADGAFSYYTLTVDPDAAKAFRENLRPLTLYLDTNFLFAIMDLHSNPLVAVSNEVIRAVQDHRLPFTLCYHERTSRELSSTVSYYGDRLRVRHWSQQLSRIAITSSHLSGIEMKYHQQNAQTATDVDGFLRQYEHADVFLETKGIGIAKAASNRLQERADLLHEYTDFLEARKKYKPDSIIDHDVTILDAVRQLRSQAKSSLDAGALLLTCDYYLYRFDWEQSKKKGVKACVVLPNQFVQILRPFIPSSPDFDRSFAETFAIPEFRTIGSGAAEASSRLLNLIASYAAFPEETAVRLLSNDLLLEQLKSVRDDDEFQNQVELAIANENATLLEEKAALTHQLEQERNQRIQAESGMTQAEENLLKTRQQVVAVSERADQDKRAKELAERRADRYALVVALLISLLATAVFFILVHGLKWQWLLDHPKSLGLQIAGGLLVLLSVLGLLYPKWRNTVWGLSGATGAFAVLLLIISMLDG